MRRSEICRRSKSSLIDLSRGIRELRKIANCRPKNIPLCSNIMSCTKTPHCFPSVFGLPNLRPDQMRFYGMQLFGIGRVLYERLRLENIASIDLRPAANLLSGSAP